MWPVSQYNWSAPAARRDLQCAAFCFSVVSDDGEDLGFHGEGLWGTMGLRVDFEREELLKAAALIQFVATDMSTDTGFVMLKSDGSRRLWGASDDVSGVVIAGELDGREYRVLLSPAQIAFLVTAARSDESASMEVLDDDSILLKSRHAEMRKLTREPRHFLFDYDFNAIETGSSGFFSARELRQHIDALLVEIDPGEEDAATAECFLGEGYLSLLRAAGTPNATEARLSGRGVSGSVMVIVDLHRLQTLLSVFSGDSDVTVILPKYQGNPIVIHSDEVIATLMPWKTQLALAREHAQEVIEEAFGMLAVQQDDDGDYPLRRHGQLIYGRLARESEPLAFQVFGVLLRDVAVTSELLSEINEINARDPYVKLIHIENQLIVEADLVAASMDAIELETAVAKISRAMDAYAVTLSVVFGGAKDEDPVERRWSNYRQTIVHAEISPGIVTQLNGPQATASWPFPEPVHVVSGWNPQGVAFDGDYVNSQIAADVLQRGGRFVMCAGVSREGNYSEPSLAIWGLSRDQAREIGRRANQDAIFEITPDELRIVSCYTDHIEATPRREGPGATPGAGYL